MLVLSNLRTRWRAFVASFLAIAVGAGIIGVTLLVYASSRPENPERLSRAPGILVAPKAANGSDRIPWTEAAAAGIPGVIDRSFYAQVFLGGRPVRDDLALDAGHGWASVQFSPYRLTAGTPPAGPGEVVLDQALGLRPGAPVTINLAAGPTAMTVSGTLDGPGVWFTDARAAELAPGVRAIVVQDRTQQGVVEPRSAAHRRFLGSQLITAMAAVALFTTGFVVSATLALATSQRRREIGLLRTVGARPAQIRRMILGEAAMVGLAGSLAGALLAVALAPLMQAILVGLEVTAPGFAVRVTAWPLLVAGVVGTGVALLGAWATSRAAARVAPIEALREAQVERRPMTGLRWVFGGTALGVGALCAGLGAVAGADDRVNLAIGAGMSLIAAAALLAPVVIGPAVRLITAPLVRRSAGAGPMLVRAELLAATRRTASVAAPIIAAVGFAVLISGMVETMRVAYPASETKKLAGQLLIVPDGTPGLSDAVVAGQPTATKAMLPTRIFIGDRVLDALGGSADGVTVDVSTARQYSLAAGKPVEVRFADGETVLITVDRVLPDDPARGAFVMPRALVRAHDRAALNDTVFLPGSREPGPVPPGAALHDAESFALADYETDARLTTALAMMLIVVAVGYSGLAVANSMAMAAIGRRPQYAVLRSAGGTRRQLRRFALTETAVVTGVAIGLGLLVTLPPLAGMASGLGVAPHLSATVTGGSILAVAVLAIGASALVSRRTP